MIQDWFHIWTMHLRFFWILDLLSSLVSHGSSVLIFSSCLFIFKSFNVPLSPYGTKISSRLLTIACKIAHVDMQWQTWCCQWAIECLAAGCDIHLHSFHITVTMARLHACGGWLIHLKDLSAWEAGRHWKNILSYLFLYTWTKTDLTVKLFNIIIIFASTK